MTNSPPSLQRLFADMKRRKVFRVMAVYGATAFVVLQVADLLAEGMGLSDQLLRVTTFLVLIGFPIAVVLAWAFESTPDGMKRTADAAPEEINAILAQPASKRIPAGLMALAGIVLLFGAWWMGRQGSPGAELNLAVSEAVASDFRKIAVLPFEDLGGNEEDDPFLAGMHVDIHGKLQGLADLRVTSLGSVGDYRGSDKSTSQIANELAVDYLLRGSVRKAGDQVRVNVQLTDVALGEDIWVNEFDREVTADNVFAILSEIARRVAEELEAALSPEEIQRLEAGLSTDNLAAINAYHRARAIMTSPRAGDRLEDLVSQLELAVELAPEFVEAWSLLAWYRSNRAALGLETMAGAALESVERTEALAPGSSEAIKARAWHTYYVEQDYSRALELMTEAEQMSPSDVDVLMGIAWLQHRLGEFEEGTQTMRRAVDLDPQNSGTLTGLAAMLQRMSRWDAARKVLERALAIDPSNAGTQSSLVHLTLQGDGDPVAAMGLAAEFGLQPTWQQSWYATLDRDYDRAARILAEVPADEGNLTPELESLRRLATSVWLEQMRGGNPETFRDSLAALLGDAPVTGIPEVKLMQAQARLAGGRETAGWAMWEEAVREIRASDDQAGSISRRWYAARLAAQYGRPEEAFSLLDEAVARPSAGVWSVPDLQLDPRFDSMRDDPRFDGLIARQKAYEAEQARLAEREGPWLP